MGDLFMSLIHTCELNGVNPFDYLNRVAAARRGVEANAVGVDALELPRDAGADRRPLGCGVEYAESCLAEKDRLRPCRSDTPKWPQNGPLRRQNRITFLASHGNRRKCSGPASTPAFPPTISRPSRCRSAPCGNTPPGEVGRSPCRSRRSAAVHREREAARETAGGGAPPRDRRGAGVAAGPLGPVGDGPAGDPPGTGASRRRLRLADRGAGPDDAGRSSDGRPAGRIRGVRTGDSAGTSSRRLGPRPAERQTTGPAATAALHAAEIRKLHRAGSGPLPTRNPETRKRRRASSRSFPKRVLPAG